MARVSEQEATAAVTAAARKLFEDQAAVLLDVPVEELPPTARFDARPPLEQNHYRETVLPIVWAALEALPDPRRGAWFEGYHAGTLLGVGHDDACPYSEED
jgi:hypothetical protein